MYTHHFGLREKPFQIAPSPKFLYPSETHDESRARILYGVEDSRGFVVVYGKVGLGKTTVLLSVLEELDAQTRTALLYQPVRNFLDLLRMTAHEFGLPSEGRDEVNLIWDLNEFFIQRMAAGEKCVLIVDEAQNLSQEVLEKLRTLSNLQTEEASLLQIVLVGQPELYEKLMDPRLLQLRQRVGVWHEIEALTEEETTDYILHRLQKAGARRPKDIMGADLCRKVHRLTGGVPRVINQVCDTAMMITYGKEQQRVRTGDVEEAARELHLDPVRSPEGAGASPSSRTPKKARSRVWLRVAMVSAILVLLMGAVWFFRDRLPLDLLGGSQVSQGSGTPAAAAANLGEEKSPEVGYSAAASPEPVHELPTTEPPSRTELASVGLPPSPAAGDSRIEENRAHMRQKLAELQSWRDAGRSVYTVHLHSFQEMSHAREFADELWQSEDWDQPLFVEKTGTDPVWYRVLAGGFRNSREARDWITEFKKTQGAVYAQATRLEQGAQVLLPVDGEAELARQGVDG